MTIQNVICALHRNSELFKLAELAPPDLLRGQLRTAGKDSERKCYLAQKLASVLPSVRQDYNTLSHTTQADSEVLSLYTLYTLYAFEYFKNKIIKTYFDIS